MARKATGTLIYTKGKGWCARVPVIVGYVDDKPVREKQWFELGTESRAVAKRKVAKIIADNAAGVVPSPTTAKAPETVDAYADTWLKDREARKIRATEYERKYYERIWRPAIGMKALGDVTAADVRGVLADLAAGRILSTRDEVYAAQSIEHVRATAFRLFQAAWREELITENRVARVSLPDMAEEEKKPRAVLTDDELGTLLAHADVDSEIKMLVLLSRTIGGLRAGDLNALDWTAFGPEFATCTLVRRKTRKKKPQPVTFEVPADVRSFVDAWWSLAGSPEAGPVFPVRRGPRAGETKKASNMSYADRLRKELVRAGIDRHELHVETATTRPVDFHSTRRAYSQALARANVNEQTAMSLTGHSDSKVHQRYLESVAVRALPSAAAPLLKLDWTRVMSEPRSRKRLSAERDTRFELATPSLGSGLTDRNQAKLDASGPEVPCSKSPDPPAAGGSCPIVVSDPLERADIVRRDHSRGMNLAGSAIGISPRAAANAAHEALGAYLRGVAAGLAAQLAAGG